MEGDSNRASISGKEGIFSEMGTEGRGTVGSNIKKTDSLVNNNKGARYKDASRCCHLFYYY